MNMISIELATDDPKFGQRGFASGFLDTLLVDGVIGDIVEDVTYREGTFLGSRKYITLKHIPVNKGDDFADTLKRVLVKCNFDVRSIKIEKIKSPFSLN
jgi:hypothetical protein